MKGILERAAEALARALDPDLWSNDESVAHRAASPLRIEVARASSLRAARIGAPSALLAALDPEDEALVEHMTGAINGGRADPDYAPDMRTILLAIRTLIQEPQGAPARPQDHEGG